MSGVSVMPSSAKEVGEDLSGRGRVGDDEVHVPEARIVVVVVDVDHERRALDERGVGPESALVRAVEREHDPLAGVVRERRGSARRAA